jgi:tryptophan synthase alpha chain
VAEVSQGFIYYVSTTGVTGMAAGFLGNIAGQVTRIRRTSGLPVAVGFGISTPEDARAIADVSDAVIVGSALIRVIDHVLGDCDGFKEIAGYLKSLKAAIS